MRITGGDSPGGGSACRRATCVRRPIACASRCLRGSGDLAGKRVLDLFAGTGALGFEALSRGARHVTFVDRSNAALEIVRANASTLGVTAQVTLRRGDALAFVARLGAADAFDLAFLDPPYAGSELPRALARLAGVGALTPGALVVVESDRRHAPGPIEGLAAIDERRYGDTLITWFVPGGPGTAGPEASDA